MQLKKDGGKLQAALALKHCEGSTFHVRVDATRQQREAASPLVRIALTDITEGWLAQQHLTGVIEAAMDAMVSIDESRNIVLFNPAAERMFGLPLAQARGTPIDRLLPEPDQFLHSAQRSEIAHSNGNNRTLPASDGLRARRANGDLFPVEACVTQVEAQGRKLITVILRELTDRMRVEKALQDSQADLNRAQVVGQIGSWRLDLQHNKLTWSDQNHRIFGIAKGTPLTYEAFLSVVHPDDRGYVDGMWQAALRGAPYDIEHRLQVNGEVKWVREKAELEFDAAGQLLGGFDTTQDITKLKQVEQELIMADQRKDEFLAMLGHELRNPLTPIRNAAHILSRSDIAEPQIRWAQELIERQVVHLTRLVDDLLDVSRIVRGKVELQQKTLALDEVVEQALVMARPLIDAKQHHFELHLPEQPVWLRGDPVRLAQILLNLLDNAAKYTPAGGHIELVAKLAAHLIEIRLRDNGIGISEELQPRIFDSFQQGVRALDRPQGGLGIGLTLAKRLLEMHGGLIKLFSAGVGMGSEFTIWLPALANTEASKDAPTQLPALAATGCRVLVVDDEPDVADSMSMLLQIEGHEVKSANCGESALALAREFHPRLVLLDIGLHGMDGYEVARRLRLQQPEAEKICLVAVTGYGNAEARARTKESGFDQHLTKPVVPEAIFQLLAELKG